MIEKVLIISLIVFAIWYSMQEGEIFGGLGAWFQRVLPEKLHQPAFDCGVCMAPWYGSLIYVIIWGINWQWPVVVLSAMGLNVVIIKLWPQKD